MTGDQRENHDGPDFCSGFSELRELELQVIRRRWRAQDLAEVRPDQLTGIAVSGGGIRSAAFSLGVIQKLANHGILKNTHYLSTVSGGGYMGASLTWYLSRSFDGQPCYGTAADKFPFLGGEAAANRRRERSSVGEKQQDRPPPDGRTIIDFIRQRSSYLVPGRGLGLLSAIGIVLRSVIVSLLGFFFLFALLSMALIQIGAEAWGKQAAWWVAGVLVAAIPVTALFYSLLAPAPFGPAAGYRWRRLYQRFVGKLLGAALSLALAGLFLMFVPSWARGEPVLLGLDLPAAAATSTLGGALLGFLGKKLTDIAPRLFAWLLPVLPPLALVLLVFGLGALGWWAARALIDGRLEILGTVLLFGPAWLWAFATLAALYLVYANLNLTGLHRFYRDRLMETFMPDPDDVRADEPSSRTSANTTELCDMFGPAWTGPYHLVNANVVLLDSGRARYRSRRGDSFVLAPHYCGSEATGWARTDRWLADSGFNIIRPVGPMTLATAMAISGAAVNPNTGADGRGVTKTATVSALLTILNIRLGYWALSPRKLERKGKRPFAFPPNFLFPGLLQGVLGFGRTDRSNWLELTDGGHFDNIGLYELVRRRVRTIYLIDGTEDRETTFSSFANAAEKAYIDFNVRLSFKDEKGFIKLMRGADTDANPLNKAYQLAERGFTTGTIEYPALKDEAGNVVEEGFLGTLHYIKSTLTKDLPEALYSYRADNEKYPAESTADQFFDEQQFEAYRALGYAIGAQLTGHLATEQPRGPASAASAQWSAGRRGRAPN